MSQQTVKMMVEAGIIPKHTLQELANWRLLPEDYVASHGVRPVRLDTTNPSDVEGGVKNLGEALTKDMAEIRETSLDEPGEYVTISYWCSDGWVGANYSVRKDKLGRLLFPNEPHWQHLTMVQFEDGPRIHITKKEPRYAGEKLIGLVAYPETVIQAAEGETNA